MIKLIMSDMDGTLLDENGQLPPGFDAMIAKLKERGVIFAPASGRQYYSLAESFAPYVDDFIFIAENGTLVRYRDEELFVSIMERQIVYDIFAAVPQDDIFKVFCGRRDGYALKSQQRPELIRELRKYYTRARWVDDFHEVADDPIKVSLFDAEGQAGTKIYPLVKQFDNRLLVVQSSDNWVDLVSPGMNKGFAVKKIQQRLNITPDECAAFGDYLNDVEMMGAVTYGFAVANAHPDLKKAAHYQTASNAEYGVLRGIEWLMERGLC